MESGSLERRAYETWMALAERYRWVRWAAKWGLSLLSLLSGIATLIIFRRGTDHFPWILGNLLLLWVGGVVFAHFREALEARNHRVIRVAIDYALQSLHHELLLFLLPIYYASTTLSSRNLWFLLVHLAATLLTGIDPWYRATILRQSAWMERLLFAFGLFASLNVGLPLIRVRSAWALLLSALLSVLALIPAIRRSFSLSWRNAVSVATLAGLLAATIIWSVRTWIPPAPLYLSVGTFARAVERLEPVEPIRKASAADLEAWGGLNCFTAISAPAGLREQVYHLWRKDGIQLSRIALSPIRGGRPGGYRTFSKRSELGAEPAGRWNVDVLTAEGQLIGRVSLVVTP